MCVEALSVVSLTYSKLQRVELLINSSVTHMQSREDHNHVCFKNKELRMDIGQR